MPFTAAFLVASAGAAWACFSASSDATSGAVAGSIAAPTNFSSSTVTASQIALSWDAPSTAPPGTYSFDLTGTMPAGSTCQASMSTSTRSCVVEGLPGSTPYTWTLKVSYQSWTSATVSTSATTASAAPSPPSPLAGNSVVGSVVTYSGSSTPVVVEDPEGTQTDDLLFLVVSSTTSTAATFQSGDSTGWQKLGTPHQGGSGSDLTVWYHILGAGQATAPSGTASSTGTVVSSAALFTSTTYVGDYLNGPGIAPTTLRIATETSTRHTATLDSAVSTNESTATFTITPCVSFTANTDVSGATAALMSYRQASGTPVLATSSVQSGGGAAAPLFTPGGVTTNAPNAVVFSFVGVDAANALSLGSPQDFTLVTADTGAASSPAVNSAFGIADEFVAAATSAVPSPTWSQTSTAAGYAYVTVGFT